MSDENLSHQPTPVALAPTNEHDVEIERMRTAISLVKTYSGSDASKAAFAYLKRLFESGAQ